MSHHIAITIERDDIGAKFTCRATAGAPCHLMCPDGCESWDPADHEHELVDAGSCGLLDFIENDDCGVWELYDGEPGPLRSGPVTLTYNDEYVSWEYAPELADGAMLDIPAESPTTVEWGARFEGEGKRISLYASEAQARSHVEPWKKSRTPRVLMSRTPAGPWTVAS